jgi:hypothetical protein
MYCIRYTVDKETAIWCDPNIRGNREPMEYHIKAHAEQECEFLNRQYCGEGFHFTVDIHPNVTVT